MLNQFDQVDYGRVEPFRTRQIKLDTAQSQESPLDIDLAGTFLYIDDDTNGKIYIRFNSEDAARIPVSAGFSVSGIMFRRIYIDWDAQSGKVVNLVYGSGVQFTPTNDLVNVSSIGEVLAPVNFASGNISKALSFERYSGSLDLETIVSPAQNVNGILIHRAMQWWGIGSLMIKTTAPAAWNDTEARKITAGITGSSDSYHSSDINNVFIPAGFGLYAQSGSTQYALAISMSYEVL